MNLRKLFGFLVALLIAGPLAAGQNCEPRQVRATDIRAGLELARKVDLHLNERGARVAVIARVGRDLSEYGLRYSHVGLALRDDERQRWKVLHLLNHCGRADSDLYEEGLGNFFLDDLFRFEALVHIPSVELQQRIATGVALGAPRKLHLPSYSLIAHPYSAKYQNSNQWVLEFMASMVGWSEWSRSAAHQHLARANYEPSVLYLPPLKRLGARLFSVNTQFDDHSTEEWRSSRYQVVSAESVMDYLAKVDRPVGQSVLALR
jgi:hypothetical protein